MSPLTQYIFVCILLHLFLLLALLYTTNTFLFRWPSAMNYTTCYKYIDMKTYHYTQVHVIFIRLFTRYDNTWTLGTTPKHKFSVSQSMLIGWKISYCCHGHFKLCFVYVTTMHNLIILIGFNYQTCDIIKPSFLSIEVVVFLPLQIFISEEYIKTHIQT